MGMFGTSQSISGRIGTTRFTMEGFQIWEMLFFKLEPNFEMHSFLKSWAIISFTKTKRWRLSRAVVGRMRKLVWNVGSEDDAVVSRQILEHKKIGHYFLLMFFEFVIFSIACCSVILTEISTLWRKQCHSGVASILPIVPRFPLIVCSCELFSSPLQRTRCRPRLPLQ